MHNYPTRIANEAAAAAWPFRLFFEALLTMILSPLVNEYRQSKRSISKALQSGYCIHEDVIFNTRRVVVSRGTQPRRETSDKDSLVLGLGGQKVRFVRVSSGADAEWVLWIVYTKTDQDYVCLVSMNGLL